MTAIIEQNATAAEDMALLNQLLGDDAPAITDGLNLNLDLDLDLSLESGTGDLDLDAELDAALAETASPLPATAADAAGELDLADADLDSLDLSADEATLLDAALDAEGPAGLPEALETPAAPETAAAPEDSKKADKKASAPKKPSTARTTYVNAKASEVLKSRLNGDVAGTIVLEFGDADLTAEQLAAKQSELLDLLNVRPHQSKDGSTQKKVAEKVVMLFAYLKNGGGLNEVLRRTFTLLAKDGYVQMGKTGNLTADLLAKPYSPGTANAQGGQMMQMLPLLRIALPDTANKGRLVVNPESVIFSRMVELLGLNK